MATHGLDFSDLQTHASAIRHIFRDVSTRAIILLRLGSTFQYPQVFSAVRSQRYHHPVRNQKYSPASYMCLTKSTFLNFLPQQLAPQSKGALPVKHLLSTTFYLWQAPEEGPCQESHLWYYLLSHFGFPWRTNIQSTLLSL